jgi:hypothetical protein
MIFVWDRNTRRRLWQALALGWVRVWIPGGIAAGGVLFRRTYGGLGTRIGERQVHG